jgi:hypothetical protein
MLKEIIRAGDGSFSGYIRSNLASQLKRFDAESASDASRAAVGQVNQ